MNNGHPASPIREQTPPRQLGMPEIEVFYRDGRLPNGALIRVITKICVGGNEFGGVLAVVAGADQTQPKGQLPGSTVVTELKTLWPCRWISDDEPELVAATRMPPEPPKGPRGII